MRRTMNDLLVLREARGVLIDTTDSSSFRHKEDLEGQS